MRWRRLGAGLLVALALLVAWEPTRVGLQTAIALPSLLGVGPTPLTLFSDPPRRSSIPYRAGIDGAEDDLAELWLPAWASPSRPAGGILLSLGVNNVGRNHPVVARVAEALARTGLAVLVPDSRALLEGRLEAGEVDGVVRAFELLLEQPEVDPERVGIAGFSVGGSLALLAAGDPRISSRVRWVNAFGAYADAEEYLAAVAVHAYADDSGAEVPWEPSPLAREVFMRLLLDQVAHDADREALRAAFERTVLDGGRAAPDPELRDSLATPAARAVHDLLSAGSLDSARAVIAALPAEVQLFLDAISPIRHADLSADVFLMHEVTDRHVPFVESRRLAAALASTGALRAHSEFRLFDHVQPNRLDMPGALPELGRLLLHLRTVLEESL